MAGADEELVFANVQPRQVLAVAVGSWGGVGSKALWGVMDAAVKNLPVAYKLFSFLPTPFPSSSEPCQVCAEALK